MSAFWNIESLEDDIPKCRFLFTLYRDEDITFKSFSLKKTFYVLRAINLYHLTFLWYFF